MSPDREAIEKALQQNVAEREEASALAEQALRRLAQLSSGLTRLDDLDPDEVRAAADTFADALTRYKQLRSVCQGLRTLLM